MCLWLSRFDVEPACRLEETAEKTNESVNLVVVPILGELGETGAIHDSGAFENFCAGGGDADADGAAVVLVAHAGDVAGGFHGADVARDDRGVEVVVLGEFAHAGEVGGGEREEDRVMHVRESGGCGGAVIDEALEAAVVNERARHRGDLLSPGLA